MRYVIWHLPRTGSNMLMGLLSQTGSTGINDYLNCGFFVGTPPPAEDWDQRVEEYFSQQRTPNGVEGTKLGFPYVAEILTEIGPHRFSEFIRSFDRHFYLTRGDLVAQAVSYEWAGGTKQWNSWDVDNDIARRSGSYPEYSREAISRRITRFSNTLLEFESLFAEHGLHPIRFVYENLVNDSQSHIKSICRSVGILDIPSVKPITRRLYVEEKQQFIARYRRGE